MPIAKLVSLPWALWVLGVVAGCGGTATGALTTAPIRSTPTVALAPSVTLVPEPPVPAVLALTGEGIEVDELGGEPRAISVAAQTTLRGLVGAVRSGERTLLPGTLPPYPELDAAGKAAAVERGRGREIRQGAISGSPDDERFHEPVGLVVHGDRQQLLKLLTGQGWVKANPRNAWSYVKMAGSVVTRLWNEQASPVSPMYLDGKLEDYALNKHGDYVLARDHMRVYDQGEAGLAIAATRDLAATVTFHHPTGILQWQAPSFGHATDDECDRERDLVMLDLLASGAVRDWAAVRGRLPESPVVTYQPDGSVEVSHYRSDGFVYEVWLEGSKGA